MSALKGVEITNDTVGPSLVGHRLDLALENDLDKTALPHCVLASWFSVARTP